MVVMIRDGVGKVHRGCVFGGYSRLFYSQGTANGNFRFYTNQAHTGKALWCLPKVFWWTRILVESAPQLVSKIKRQGQGLCDVTPELEPQPLILN